MAIRGVIQRVTIDISATGAGTTDVIAGIAGECIHILSLFVTTELDANLIFKRGSTAMTGTVYLAARGGFVYGHEPFAVWSTLGGETFGIYRAATANLGGSIVYVQGPI